MYYDLGLADWVFEIEQTTGKQISDRLMRVINDYSGAQKKAAEAMILVKEHYTKANEIIRNIIS